MKTIYLLLFALIFSTAVNAQYYESKNDEKKKEKKASEKSFKDRVHFGGNIGLEFSSYSSLIQLSPVAIYDVSNNFKVGLGLNYIYMRQEISSIKYETSIYGPKLLALYSPFKNIMASTEFEYNYIDNEFAIEPYWHSSWFVGIGYAVPVGKRGSMVLSISYDVLYDTYKSYYANPWRPTIGFYF